MEKRTKIVLFLMLAGLFLASCRIPSIINDRLQEFINRSTPTPPTQTQPSPTLTPTQEQEITPQSQIIQIVDRTIFEERENPKYEIDGMWPNLEGPETVVDHFNVDINQIIEGIQDDFIATLNEQPSQDEGQGEPQLSYLTFDYEITYADQRYFSFFLTFDQYIALAAHPFPFSHALNYDTQNAVVLSLEDLFLPGMDVIHEIGNLLDPILVSREFGYEDEMAAEVIRQRENWNLLSEGLQINFDVYDVGPYAAGPQYILIPWDELSEILDLEGPAGRMIE